MTDPNLVEAVLADEWAADFSILEHRGGPVADFLETADESDLIAASERARQAALGHRALQLLSEWIEGGECRLVDDAKAIIAELRGAK